MLFCRQVQSVALAARHHWLKNQGIFTDGYESLIQRAEQKRCPIKIKTLALAGISKNFCFEMPASARFCIGRGRVEPGLTNALQYPSSILTLMMGIAKNCSTHPN